MFALKLIFILLQFQSLPESLSSLKSLAQQALGQNTPAPGTYPRNKRNIFIPKIFSSGFPRVGTESGGRGRSGSTWRSTEAPTEERGSHPALVRCGSSGCGPTQQGASVPVQVGCKYFCVRCYQIFSVCAACWRQHLTTCPTPVTARD